MNDLQLQQANEALSDQMETVSLHDSIELWDDFHAAEAIAPPQSTEEVVIAAEGLNQAAQAAHAEQQPAVR